MIKFWIGFIVWFIGFIPLEVYRNYRIIEVLEERPNYWNSFLFRSFFAVVCLALMIPDFDLGSLQSWIGAFPYVVFEASSFYLVFDPWLNIKRGKEIDHRGKTSGWIDPLLTKPVWWILKGMSLILMGLSAYNIFQ